MKKYFLVITILIGTIALCYSSIYYFVLKDNNALINSGPIGDVIGGLTAPIINLISIILIFLSFREQFEANELQRKALNDEIKRSNTLKELDHIIDLLREAKNEISCLYIQDDFLNPLNGEDAISQLPLEKNQDCYSKLISDLAKIFELLDFICQKTESYQFEIRDERVIFEKLRLVFTEEIYDGLNSEIEKPNRFPKNSKIELSLQKLRLYIPRILKYEESFINKDLNQIKLDGELRIEKLQKAYLYK